MSDNNKKFSSNAVIKVIGVGGGGGNALNTMIESGLSGVEFIAANTDVQALQANFAPIKIQLGRELTKGLGAGANPEMGRNAALEDKAILQEVLAGADMVFVTGGMGGGTGTGAAPIIAQVARELGALTVGVVTKPFSFEGKRRKHQSEYGIQSLRQSVDTLITIPNQRLLSIAPPEMSMLDGFKLADEVLLNAVKGISDIINIPGRVNVDFADVKTIMSEMGMALMGIGEASGSNRAAEAARAAINSPLLEDIDIEGATGILINITGSSSMTLHEISEASTLIQEAAHEDANIIFGAVIDETMSERIRVTVIATGFDQVRVAYPEQTQAYSNAGAQANTFVPPHSSPVAAGNAFVGGASAGRPQNGMSAHGAAAYESRPVQNPPSYMPPQPSGIPQNPFSRPGAMPFGSAQSVFSHTSHVPSGNGAAAVGGGAYRSAGQDMMGARSFASPAPQAPSSWNQPAVASPAYNAAPQAHSAGSAAEQFFDEAASMAAAMAAAPAPYANAKKEEEDSTINALKLANELSDIDMDSDFAVTDFETPAFMRNYKKEEIKQTP